MEIIVILFQQILIMFMLMFVGAYLFKTDKLTLEGSKSIGNMLLNVVMPIVVIKSYIAEMTTEKLIGMGVAFGLTIAALALSMVVSAIFFRKQPIINFGTAFSNAGFIGIPLVAAIYGDEAVFYISTFVALIGVLQWTYGVFIITGDKSTISLKKILTNPVLIGTIIGMVLFLCQIKLPGILTMCMNTIAGINTPLAMFSLGTYLAQVSLKELLTDRYAYYSCGVRLILIPLLTMALFSLVPAQYNMIKSAVLITAAAPIGSNVAIFAQIHGKDYKYSVKGVCLTTLCSIVTVPLIIGLAQMVW